MKKYIIQFLVIFFLIVPCLSYAQTNKDSALALFKNVINKYNNADHLSFKVEYTYKDLANPKELADSLNGTVMINKNNYHLLLGNTETIHNDQYNMILFKEDSLMYISKPTIGNIISNPILILDSMFTKIKNIDISLTIKKRTQLVTLDFPDGMDYKSAEFLIDERTGYLLRVTYKVNAIQMLNPADRAGAANTPLANLWGIVQCLYYQHKTGAFTDDEFDEKKFFVKKDKEYKPINAYRNYKVFISSPGL